MCQRIFTDKLVWYEETGLFFSLNICQASIFIIAKLISPSNAVMTPTPISEENIHAVVIIFHEKMAQILKKNRHEDVRNVKEQISGLGWLSIS